MINYLRGKIQWKNGDSVVVVNNDIGYAISAPKPFLETIKVGEAQEFFTHEYLRENSRELYGFPSREELNLFHDLIKVNGVGPRMALNVLSLGSEQVRKAISGGDVGVLTSISGVGKKTAQKIVLELKGVLSETSVTSADEEALDALCRLGYSGREAREVLQKIEGTESPEEKIKEALKILGKK